MHNNKNQLFQWRFSLVDVNPGLSTGDAAKFIESLGPNPWSLRSLELLHETSKGDAWISDFVVTGPFDLVTFEVETCSSGGRTGIESALLKGNTQLNLLHIGTPPDLARRLPAVQKLKIKLDLDLQPPPHATTEVRAQILPTPYQVQLCDLSSLLQASCTQCCAEDGRTALRAGIFMTSFVWSEDFFVDLAARIPNVQNLPHVFTQWEICLPFPQMRCHRWNDTGPRHGYNG